MTATLAAGYAPPRPRPRARHGVPVLLFLVVLAVHLASPDIVIADSSRSVYVASELLHHGDIYLERYSGVTPDDYSVYDAHGHVVPLFPWAPTLFAIPVLVARGALHRLLPGHVATSNLQTTPIGETWSVQVIAMALVVAATSVVLYAVARHLLLRLPPARRTGGAAAVGLVFAFCTSAWSTASRSLWQHGPSMLCLSLAVLFALRASSARSGRARELVLLGASVAASYTMRPTNAIPVLVLSLWALVTFRRRAVPYFAGALGVAVSWVAANLTWYHQVRPLYYVDASLGHDYHDFHVHVWGALAGNLVSPSRGLLVFSPALVLAGVGVALLVRRRALDGLHVALVTCVLAHWVSISLFAHWWGGNSYGPRLFTDMVPFLVVLSVPALEALLRPAPAGRRTAWALTGLLVTASFVINAEGATTRSSTCWNDTPVPVDLRPSRLWDWRDAQFTAGIRGVLAGAPHEFDRASALRYGCPPGSVAG